MTDLVDTFKSLLRDIQTFSEHASSIKLRQYQKLVAASVVDSVIKNKGLSFVVVFPRQSGKNELQAQIETYLLTMYSQLDGEIVKISPTWKPQSLNAMRRLERILKRNLVSRYMWEKESGYIYKAGGARMYFLSGSPTANIVGATASTLLECDEAQDVSIEKWDKEIAPMAASTNATRIFWGTAWTSQTLLAREKRAALEAEKADGIRRVFEIDADLVGKEVPAYARFVSQEIAKHGRGHPFIKTQFYSEEIDAECGMFPPARLALTQGSHPYQDSPLPGHTYAFCLDIAGEDQSTNSQFTNLPTYQPTGDQLYGASKHDSSVLTIVDIDLSALSDSIINAPIYRVIHRKQWTGINHANLYAQIKALTDTWQPRRLVIDATGIGEPLASFLEKSYPGQVIPFKFTQASKSELGWKFISLIETGRFKDYDSQQPDAEGCRLKAESLKQFAATQMEILPGPGKTMRWSVPDGARDTHGRLIHDDFVLSAALCSVLDEEQWGEALSVVVHAIDPLKELTF